jgi:hypothetical protein
MEEAVKVKKRRVDLPASLLDETILQPNSLIKKSLFAQNRKIQNRRFQLTYSLQVLLNLLKTDSYVKQRYEELISGYQTPN